MFEIGRLCVKIAGRDAKGKCLVVDVLDNHFVMIDGQVRRRKCNINHLEPLDNVLKIKKNASHADVVKALDSAGIKVAPESKKKEQKEKPVKQRKSRKTETASADSAQKEPAEKKAKAPAKAPKAKAKKADAEKQ